MWSRKRKGLAVALVCGDWRLHHTKSHLNRKLRRALGVDGIDYVALPGPDGLKRPEREAEWRAALAQMKFFISVHAPVALAVVAHQRCLGHSVSDEAHATDAAATAQALKTETGFAGPVAALVAEYRSDLNWTLKLVKQF
jgi:hypothetical protein